MKNAEDKWRVLLLLCESSANSAFRSLKELENLTS
jgi:hypothetical protein